ncbi:unnamed protein product [Adineta steineri]|uniref:Anaphase-promoting complex subunit 10 n=1 Tax=Adineta steineri TaxID=433720 RepID=A0A819WML0_9BILA|nr:unnamed protein product [Adineta steineri]CAF4124998.1 unnamed protein product [Adineta steineri]
MYSWNKRQETPNIILLQSSHKNLFDEKELLIYIEIITTHRKISIRIGINHNNLVELRCFEIHEPAGSVIVPARDARSNPIRTWMIQIAVLANHQSGCA